MGTSTYGISLQVCKSLAYKWDVKLNTRREILHLQATMYYFVYHMNTIALYWEEKPTSLMNENRWIGNPWITGIVECVGTKSLDGKMCWVMITKTTMVVIFNLQNYHFMTLFLLTEEVFQVNGQNQPGANLQVFNFHSQLRKMSTPKPLNT